jgi:NAD(P)-dependent dehydrogenase (short-subunit alcohol dehydrogenase family)
MNVIGNGSLHGLAAIVTGGAKGIGLAIARRLAADGATIALIGRDVAALERAASELGARHAVADVTDHEAFSGAIATLGACDILVNNAGAAVSKPFAKHAMGDFHAMLAVNLLSAVTACQAVLPGMRARGFGRIVNIASTAGLKGYAYVTAYAAAKHALVGFTRSLALETVKDGITVNAVCPGFTDTDMLSSVPESIRDRLLARVPLGRFAHPDEIAHAVAYVAGDGGYMTGTCLDINGGLYM